MVSRLPTPPKGVVTPVARPPFEETKDKDVVPEANAEPRPVSALPRASSIPAGAKPAEAEPTSERVKVVVRVRPCLRTDETPGAMDLTQSGSGKVTLFRPEAPVPQSDFIFDKVLGPEATQHDVYNAGVKEVVEDVMQGYNGTVLTYGQTGAGKTYTLGNTEPTAIGMIPRCVAEIFKKAAQDPFHTYSVSMSYIQIYTELLSDLLQPENDNLQIREDASNGVFVSGAQEVPVTSLEECLHFLELGERNRVFAFTHLNSHSSRSHAVVMVTVVKSRKFLTSAEKVEMRKAEREGLLSQKVKVGKLYLVDLAGSERLKKSRSVGLRATEARSINLSLTTLGMCISARAADERHVPFRDSKLTRLLQESLGGNAKTTLVVCVADAREHVDESLQSLQFGSRAMCVKNRPVVNERVDYRLLHAELVGQVDRASDRAHELEAVLYKTEEERDAAQAELAAERDRFQRIMDTLRGEAAAELAKEQARAASAHQQLALTQEQMVMSQEHAQQQHAQELAQLEARIAALQEERSAMAEAHYTQVSSLNSQLAEVLAAHSAATAAHRREATALTLELEATKKQLVQAQAESAALQAANAELQSHLDLVQEQQEATLAALRALQQALAAAMPRSVEPAGSTDVGLQQQQLVQETSSALAAVAAAIGNRSQSAGALPRVGTGSSLDSASAVAAVAAFFGSPAQPGVHGAIGAVHGAADSPPTGATAAAVAAAMASPHAGAGQPDQFTPQEASQECAAGSESPTEVEQLATTAPDSAAVEVQGHPSTPVVVIMPSTPAGPPSSAPQAPLMAGDSELTLSPIAAESSLIPPSFQASPDAYLRAPQQGQQPGELDSPGPPVDSSRSSPVQLPTASLAAASGSASPAVSLHASPARHTPAAAAATAASPASDVESLMRMGPGLKASLNPAFEAVSASPLAHRASPLKVVTTNSMVTPPLSAVPTLSAAAEDQEDLSEAAAGSGVYMELQAVLGVLHTMLQELSFSVQSLEGANDAQRAEVKQLHEELSQRAQHIAKLDTTVGGLGSDLAEVRDQLAASHADAAQLRQQVSKLEQTVAVRTAHGDACEQSIQQLQAQLEGERTAKQAVESQLTEAQQTAESTWQRRLTSLQARSRARRVLSAVLTIQRAFRRFKEAQMRQALERDGQALEAADRATRLQCAHIGADLVRDSVVTMREAVEAIMTTFVGRKRELDARARLQSRISAALPLLAHKRQPAAPAASVTTIGPAASASVASVTAGGAVAGPMDRQRSMALTGAVSALSYSAAAAAAAAAGTPVSTARNRHFGVAASPAASTAAAASTTAATGAAAGRRHGQEATSARAAAAYPSSPAVPHTKQRAQLQGTPTSAPSSSAQQQGLAGMSTAKAGSPLRSPMDSHPHPSMNNSRTAGQPPTSIADAAVVSQLQTPYRKL